MTTLAKKQKLVEKMEIVTSPRKVFQYKLEKTGRFGLT